MISKTYLPIFKDVEDTFSDITPDNIRVVLVERSQLGHRPNPLDCLTLVDEYLANHLLPDGPYSRHLALMELLIDLITQQLCSYRKAMEICPHPLDATRRQAFRAIRQDVRTGNRHLIIWSWLYYGFIRLDLNISQERFAKAAHTDDRTIRRYQVAGFLRIAELLTQSEGQARKSLVLTSAAVLKNQFSGDEISITLKPNMIFEMLQTDRALMSAFLKLLGG